MPGVWQMDVTGESVSGSEIVTSGLHKRARAAAAGGPVCVTV